MCFARDCAYARPLAQPLGNSNPWPYHLDMPIDLILPVCILLALIAYGLIAAWFIWPALMRLNIAQALIPLIFLHCFRFIGLAFLIPGVTSEPLDPRFANPAAYGDLLAALLAFVAIFSLRGNWRTSIPIVWIFNIEGTLDLINAVTQGLRFTEDGHLGATFFIPAIVVPALLVTHAMIFIILLKGTVADPRGK